MIGHQKLYLQLEWL